MTIMAYSHFFIGFFLFNLCLEVDTQQKITDVKQLTNISDVR